MTIVNLNWATTEISATDSITKIANYDIPQGYINATQMCKANGKEFKHWNETRRSEAFIEALSCAVGITTAQLIIQISAQGQSGLQGTWVHPRVAINIGQWISPEFDVWVSGKIEELMRTGQTTLTAQPVITLHPDDLALMKMIELGIKCAEMVRDDRAIITYNTQLQNLIQRTTDKINSPKALPPIEELTVSEVLEREGFKLSSKRVKNSLGQIGKLVKANYLIDTGSEPKIIQKLVGSNHKPTEIKLYSKDYFERISEIAVGYWESKEIIYN